MTNIVNELEKKNLENITNEKKRNCPNCGDEIIHTSKKSCYEANRLNKRCKKCYYLTINLKGEKNGTWNKDRHTSPFTYACPKCHKSIHYTNFDNLQRAIKNKTYCRSCAIEKRDYTEIYTLEVRLKMKQKAIARVRRMGINIGVCPFYNKNACHYFDQLNKEYGWNLRHALNGGEINVIGYSLDAYDKDENIVVEYDEPNHYDRFGNLKQRDIIRMKTIIKYLHCKFYRYNQKIDEFKKYE
jgi:predicted RNA-binding Zn-ribbon protein involved in translation (DUF1610 family)